MTIWARCVLIRVLPVVVVTIVLRGNDSKNKECCRGDFNKLDAEAELAVF